MNGFRVCGPNAVSVVPAGISRTRRPSIVLASTRVYRHVCHRECGECIVSAACFMRTPLCDLLGIDAPIIQAGMSVYTSPELAAAVSEAGGLGSLGVWQRSAEKRGVTDLEFARARQDLIPNTSPIVSGRRPRRRPA